MSQGAFPVVAATNPKASDKALAALLREHPADLELARAVATHANASPKTLGGLICRAPHEVVKHPAFVLSLLGGATAVAKLPRHGVLSLVARGLAPPEVLAFVADSRRRNDAEGFAYALGLAEDIGARRLPVIRNFRAFRWLAEALADGPRLDLAFAELGPRFAAFDPRAGADQLEPVVLAIRSTSSEAEARMLIEGLTRHPRLDAAVADELLRTLARLAFSCGSPFPDLAVLAEIVAELLARPELPAELVLTWSRGGPDPLGEGRDGVVRGAILAALRRGLLDARAMKALCAADRTARMALARAAPLQGPVGLALAADADPRVRAELAGRPDLPSDVLAILVRDDDLPVLAGALVDPRASAAASEALHHLRRGVRRVAARFAEPSALEGKGALLAADPDGLVRRTVADREDAPAALLGALAVDASPTVRCAVARNPAAPADVVAILASDADPAVREGVAKRSKAKG